MKWITYRIVSGNKVADVPPSAMGPYLLGKSITAVEMADDSIGFELSLSDGNSLMIMPAPDLRGTIIGYIMYK